MEPDAVDAATRAGWLSRLLLRVDSSNRPAPAGTPDGAMLQVDDLHFAYDGEAVLHGVSMRVGRGKVCGLLGPNGSGKTTMFKCALNILPYCRGSITVAGRECRRLPPRELAGLVSYVPQEHRQAFPYLVREVVEMGRTPHRTGLLGTTRRDRELSREALERVGISHLADISCNRLSGGQRQLVLIARAVAQASPVMLLDEPTSALDFNNQLLVWKTLRAIAADGVSILACCHDPNHILWFCDQVAIIDSGAVVAEGKPEAVVRGKALDRIYGDSYRHACLDGLSMIYPKL